MSPHSAIAHYRITSKIGEGRLLVAEAPLDRKDDVFQVVVNWTSAGKP